MLTKAKSLLERFKQWLKVDSLCWQVMLFSISSDIALAGTNNTVENFVGTVRKTFTLVRDLMLVVGFVCGMVFMIIGLLKFKAHKDNPAQIPLSTPIALIAVSSGLLFLPTVFELAGSALFGDVAQPGLPLSKTLNF